jgi:hypothetical protein
MSVANTSACGFSLVDEDDDEEGDKLDDIKEKEKKHKKEKYQMPSLRRDQCITVQSTKSYVAEKLMGLLNDHLEVKRSLVLQRR